MVADTRRPVQGTTLTVATARLSAIDPDNSTAQLEYTVTSSLKGYIQVNGANASTFTQADIDSNKVTFVHDGTEGAQAGFNFTVSDGITTLAVQPFDIAVSPVNDPPAVTNLGATMAEVRALAQAMCGSRLPVFALHAGHAC